MDKNGNKTGGRKKGSLNKATKVSKQIINDVLSEYYDSGNLQKDFDEIKNPKERLDIAVKLMEYVMPKLKSTSVEANVDVKQSTFADRLRNLANPDSED